MIAKDKIKNYIPLKNYTIEQKLNALVRLSFYISVLLIILTLNVNYLFILIVVLIITYVVNISNETETEKKIEKNRKL